MAIKPETRFYLNSSHTCVNQVLVDVENLWRGKFLDFARKPRSDHVYDRGEEFRLVSVVDPINTDDCTSCPDDRGITSLGKVLSDLKIEYANIIPITPIAYGNHGWVLRGCNDSNSRST